MGVRGTLEGKDSECVDTMFWFIAAFIDCTIGFVRDFLLTVVHKKYSELLFELIKDWDDEGMSSGKMENVSEDVITLKKLMKNTLKRIVELYFLR